MKPPKPGCGALQPNGPEPPHCIFLAAFRKPHALQIHTLLFTFVPFHSAACFGALHPRGPDPPHLVFFSELLNPQTEHFHLVGKDPIAGIENDGTTPIVVALTVFEDVVPVIESIATVELVRSKVFGLSSSFVLSEVLARFGAFSCLPSFSNDVRFTELLFTSSFVMDVCASIHVLDSSEHVDSDFFVVSSSLIRFFFVFSVSFFAPSKHFIASKDFELFLLFVNT